MEGSSWQDHTRKSTCCLLQVPSASRLDLRSVSARAMRVSCATSAAWMGMDLPASPLSTCLWVKTVCVWQRGINGREGGGEVSREDCKMVVNVDWVLILGMHKLTQKTLWCLTASDHLLYTSDFFSVTLPWWWAQSNKIKHNQKFNSQNILSTKISCKIFPVHSICCVTN